MMRKYQPVLTLLLTVSLTVFAQKQYTYPVAPQDTTTDTYFNDIISDPYQWMENSSDPRLQPWLEQEQEFTTKLAKQQTRFWDLRAQIVSMYYDGRRRTNASYNERDEKFVSKYDFAQEMVDYTKSFDLLYKRFDQYNYKTLIKAKDYLPHKDDKISYGAYNVNEEEDLAAITISVNGSDWETGYVFDLKTREQLPITINNLRDPEVIWHHKTMYFITYDTPVKGRESLDVAKGQKLCKFEVGKDTIPKVVYVNPDTTGTNPFHIGAYDDHMFIYHFIKVKDKYYKAISHADLNKVNFFPRSFLIYPNKEKTSMEISYVSNDSVWLATNWNAPNFKVLLANLNKPNQLSEFVPQYEMVLKEVNPLGKDKLTCIYRHQGQDIAMIYDLNGRLLKKIDFPTGKKLKYFYEEDSISYTHFCLSSFFHPDLLYQISLKNLTFKPVESVRVPYKVNDLETRYVTYASKDGTQIPMYITCKKDVKLDGNNPVMIYAYGGYGIVVEPDYTESSALFIAHGGILAVPNIRGGGAKGSDWAIEGRRLKKQNAIDDFIGAAEYLIKEKYTNPDKIITNGGSHGGMLVTAAMVQRPELYKAVIASAGCHDMLRFHHYTIGNINTNLNEFGTPDIEEDYECLKAYSPLLNIKKGVKYPNLLLLTGDSDDRVPPFHTYKFLASLQENANNEGLYTLFLTHGAGHGGSLTQEDFENKLLFKYYFIFDNLDIKFYY